MPAGKSFDICTARDYLDQLVHHSCEDLAHDPASSKAGITAAIFCWHLHDWVWAEHKQLLRANLGLENDIDDFCRFLIEHCAELEVIQGVANGSKHFKTDPDQKEPTSTARGWVGPGWVAPGWVGMDLNIDFRGKNVQFMDILSACVKYWDEFFQAHLS